MRIYIIGNSCSGKTTLAKELSQELSIPWYSTDDIYWERKFDVLRSKEARLPLLHDIAVREEWIIEGSSTGWTHEAVQRADVVVELKLHRIRLVLRALRRHVRRRFHPEEGPETLLNVSRLIRYIWENEDPRKIHRQQYDALLVHAKERVLIESGGQRRRLKERLRHARRNP